MSKIRCVFYCDINKFRKKSQIFEFEIELYALLSQLLFELPVNPSFHSKNFPKSWNPLLSLIYNWLLSTSIHWRIIMYAVRPANAGLPWGMQSNHHKANQVSPTIAWLPIDILHLYKFGLLQHITLSEWYTSTMWGFEDSPTFIYLRILLEDGFTYTGSDFNFTMT